VRILRVCGFIKILSNMMGLKRLALILHGIAQRRGQAIADLRKTGQFAQSHWEHITILKRAP
jgi:hypothetical protein